MYNSPMENKVSSCLFQKGSSQFPPEGVLSQPSILCSVFEALLSVLSGSESFLFMKEKLSLRDRTSFSRFSQCFDTACRTDATAGIRFLSFALSPST
uniref:Uncharacterized protein LOC107473027 n=1 Tax=Rhizophora mucronata TaxID=61149 RepID=A0A2P2JKJ7_RHIMU